MRGIVLEDILVFRDFVPGIKGSIGLRPGGAVGCTERIVALVT